MREPGRSSAPLFSQLAMSVYNISARLSKLIPRLASNFDGEVVETVRAIERALRSAGADWHDLAAAITTKPAVAGRPRNGLLDMAETLFGLDDLNTWEINFTHDMVRLLRAGARLTDKQEQALRRCYARHGEENET